MRFMIILSGAIMLCNLANAQSKIRIEAKSEYVSDNLDLNAVEDIYLSSTLLQDFERKLNFPNYTISNLDLDNDNKVDYSRVIEKHKNNTNLIVLQSVIGRNKYEDVAEIYTYNDFPAQTQSNNERDKLEKTRFIASFFLSLLDIFLLSR